MAIFSKFQSCNTAIAGVMSGPEVETRQLALGMIKESVAQRIAADPKDKRFFFDLVPEPENPFDSAAIQIMADCPGLGRVQLGYIRNSDTICDFCNCAMERFPTSKKCQQCKRTDHLRRDGLATKVSAAMQADPHARFYGELLQVTGGADGKNYGCNLVIRQVIEHKKKAVANA